MIFEQRALPRGIRNHNPGNIIKNDILWQGMSDFQEDARFVTFESPVWGLRALMKILLRYYGRHGLDTVQSIINRWAPPHENATDHYAGHVAKILGVSRLQQIAIQDRKILLKLAAAIVLHENGKPPKDGKKFWYPDSVYQTAADLALQEERK